jgi:hypothetical protein
VTVAVPSPEHHGNQFSRAISMLSRDFGANVGSKRMLVG